MNESSWTMNQYLVLYVAVFLMLGALDGIWLGLVAKDLYRVEMGSLMSELPRVVPAGLFYLAYPVAVVYFSLATMTAPAADSNTGTSIEAFFRCAALGLTAYGTYNLTNLSIVRGFSTSLALIDMAWGTVATGVAGAVAFSAVRWWLHKA